MSIELPPVPDGTSVELTTVALFMAKTLVERMESASGLVQILGYYAALGAVLSKLANQHLLEEAELGTKQ